MMFASTGRVLPRCRALIHISSVPVLAGMTLGCGDDPPVETSIGVGLSIELSDPAASTCGLELGAAPIQIGNPPPSDATQGTPAAAGGSDVKVVCSVQPSATPGMFAVSLKVDSAMLSLVVEGGNLPAGAAGTAKVNLNDISHNRQLYQEGCTLSAAPPFSVAPGEFWGSFVCPNATSRSATDINCVIDGVIVLTGCSG